MGRTSPKSLLVALLLAAPLLPLAACDRSRAAPHGWLHVIGGPGRGPGRFVAPRGISVHGETLFVVDKTGRLQSLERTGGFLHEATILDSRAGFPVGVLAEADGGAVVVDTHNHRLRWFDASLNETNASVSFARDAIPFSLPQRATRSARGFLYVTEFGEGERNRVQGFDRDGAAAVVFGGYGFDPGRFTRPIGIAAIGDELFVVDVSDRVIVYAEDGTFRREFGRSGAGVGELKYAYGVCAIGEELFVAEYGNHRVQRFHRDGRSLGTYGRAGHGDGEFSGPWDVACGADGLLYVCDTGNHRVCVIDPNAVAWDTTP